VHDHHGYAGLKFIQGVDILRGPVLLEFFVVGRGGECGSGCAGGGRRGADAIGYSPIVAEIVEVVQYGKAGVPECRSDGAELVDLLVGKTGLFLDQPVGSAGQHHGDMIFDPQLQVAF